MHKHVAARRTFPRYLPTTQTYTQELIRKVVQHVHILRCWRDYDQQRRYLQTARMRETRNGDVYKQTDARRLTSDQNERMLLYAATAIERHQTDDDRTGTTARRAEKLYLRANNVR